jgi:hypothetical protein
MRPSCQTLSNALDTSRKIAQTSWPESMALYISCVHFCNCYQLIYGKIIFLKARVFSYQKIMKNTKFI